MVTFFFLYNICALISSMNGGNFPARTEHWTHKVVYNFWVVCCIPGREFELWGKGEINGLSKGMESGYSMKIKCNQRWSDRRKHLRLSEVFSFTELCAMHWREVGIFFKIKAACPVCKAFNYKLIMRKKF